MTIYTDIQQNRFITPNLGRPYKSSKDYPEELRKLIVENPEDGMRYIFLANNLDVSAELISSFYRNRWSVECSSNG